MYSVVCVSACLSVGHNHKGKGVPYSHEEYRQGAYLPFLGREPVSG